MVDKSRERKIVEMVFGDRSDVAIEETEKPDFRCRVSESIDFGVEVTEFYLSESQARLSNISGYATDLLKSKAYRHKDDKHRIPVETVVYHRAETGAKFEIEAIVCEATTVDDIVSKVGGAIELKNRKLEAYEGSVVDLVVHDVEAVARFESVGKLIQSVKRTGVFGAIVGSKFREIYLVTALGGGWVCVPLRANMLVSEVLAFWGLFKEYYGEKIESLTLGAYLVELARHLVCRLGGVEYEFSVDEGLRLVFGSVSIGYGEGQVLEIVDVSSASPAGRDIVEFSDEGDLGLHDFVAAKIDSVFASAEVLFPASSSA